MSEPERPESQLLAERREKLERLRAARVEPFPHEFPDRTEIAVIREAHDGLSAGEETDARYRVAGRMAARRGHGKAAFLDLVDRSGRIQLHAREDLLGAESFERLVGLDLGDILGAEGIVFATKRGELSLRLEGWTLLAKSLRPPPEKYHGLEDVELRYRHRELDLIANAETRDLFRRRAAVVAAVREWLNARGFLEVETPVLQPLYGGALARPFKTHHNALDRDLYLRIATELYLKRCVVGGIERVYELGKDFRNEGISPKHNPEFTMLEWYEAYADYADAAERPSRDQLAAAMGSEPDPAEGWGKLVDGLLSKLVEPELIQPTFVLDYPVELSPFAKSHRSEQGLVERWEAFVGGIEIANAFTELNDPDEQRRRFEQQRDELQRGDEEAQPFDEAYLEALERGMPPTAGVGLGIDRLTMILTGAHNLSEVVLFPTMRS